MHSARRPKDFQVENVKRNRRAPEGALSRRRGWEISRYAEHGQELFYVVFRVLAEDLQFGSLCVAALSRFGEVVQVRAGLRDETEVASSAGMRFPNTS